MTEPHHCYGPAPFRGWSDARIDAELRSAAAGSALDGDRLNPAELALIRRKLRGEVTDAQFGRIALSEALAIQASNQPGG